MRNVQIESKKSPFTKSAARLLLVSVLSALALSAIACGGGNQGGGSGGTNSSPTTPTVTVTPASGSITVTQSLIVAVAVSGASGTPTGSVVLSSGSYTSPAAPLSSGSASITIAAGSLATGTDTLTARYTPDSASTSAYNSASGSATVTVAQPASTPTVTVTPAAGTILTTQSLSVSIAVSGAGAAPTGSVVLSSGSYTSSAATLSSGSATISIPAGSLPAGSDTLTAKYTPDSGSTAAYTSATGMATIMVNTASSTAITVNIDTLANRHTISPYIYGGNPSQGTAQAADLGMTVARYGGNQSSNYNWKLHTYNSAADWYFEDFDLNDSNGGPFVSENFITEYQKVGVAALVTMPMLNWAAREQGHWSFSVAKYGAQCKADPYNADAGNGYETDCKTPVTTSADTSAYYPLVDTPSQCPTGTADGSTCLDRQTWAQALATAFGSGTCIVPDSSITSCHFYDMDNEIDIWNGTHRDVHPNPPGYGELANTYEAEASALKTWDPAAVRFGPVSCCWWFYWNVGPSGDDKTAHGGIDFLAWWLNQVYWLDKINGARTLDVFDIHAYPTPSTSGLTVQQSQLVAANAYRDYWDPTYKSTSGDMGPWTANMQPNQTYPFRIPRMKALVNAIYPGTPLSFTEWSAAAANVSNAEADFSTALGDADAYGAMGREGLTFATRWGAPQSGNPNYLALKLYGNYDGAHDKFGTLSISDVTNADPNLFSSYAALDAAGSTMTVMVINRDPNNSAQITFNTNGFTPSTYASYSISSTAASSIQASSSQTWTASRNFAPFSITLLVINGTVSAKPLSEWHLNPDDLMIPASGTALLHPALTSGSAAVTLSSAVFDAFEGAPACNGSLVLTTPSITASTQGVITVNAGNNPGFCHYTVTGSDGAVTQTQGGWIIVGNPPASLVATSGNNQSGTAGTALSQPLTVTLTPGQSGGNSTGAGVLFTTSGGILSNGTTTGSSVIATTDSSGAASVILTLPAAKGNVTVTAQDMFAVGGASVSFTETAN
ncbi:MAG TPA: glycoside hydrolase family 44 protein [Terracidiphilus sp.]|nr:glycoside hydrolase family 44 protein [Terracidiphilus sp.]